MSEEQKNANREDPAPSLALEGSAFGRVLARLMEVRGLPVEGPRVAEFVGRSGLDVEVFRARLAGDRDANPGDLSALAGELALSRDEMQALADAYVYEKERAGGPESVLKERGDLAPEEELRCCQAGSKSDNPCWREAVATFRGVACCEEHARLYEFGEEEDEWHYALDKIEDWFRGPVAEDRHGKLERLARNLLDEARTEYARAHAAAHAADLIAKQGPPEEGELRLTLEQSEELTRLILRSDSFNNARAILEDAPEEAFGAHDRWVIVDALDAAGEAADEEYDRYRREIGIRPAE